MAQFILDKVLGIPQLFHLFSGHVLSFHHDLTAFHFRLDDLNFNHKGFLGMGHGMAAFWFVAKKQQKYQKRTRPSHPPGGEFFFAGFWDDASHSLGKMMQAMCINYSYPKKYLSIDHQGSGS